jgi:hypothetical protein
LAPLEKDYEAWVNGLIAHYGARSRKEFFGRMLLCSVVSENGVITIKPTFHEKPEAWSGEGIDESMHVRIAKNADPADLGAALRLAFSRCT